MSRKDRDPYVLLGVHRQASSSDIGRAYRRAARATHPDGRPGDPAAAERFQEVTSAYETLRDPGRRAAYDRRHPLVRPTPRVSPPPVRLGPRPPADAVRLGPPPMPLGRRPVAWVEPVELAPRRPPPVSGGADDELLELATALFRSLRSTWL